MKFLLSYPTVNEVDDVVQSPFLYIYLTVGFENLDGGEFHLVSSKIRSFFKFNR